MKIFLKSACLFAAAFTFFSCTPKSPVEDPGKDNGGENGGNNSGEVIADSKNTDKAIEVLPYDITAKSVYFKGVFNQATPQGYSKPVATGFMYSSEYKSGEDIYMNGTWIDPLRYASDGDAENTLRAYVSNLEPATTYYLIACAEYENEVSYKYSPVYMFTTSKVGTDYNGVEYVDLGLSVKWAKCNVGARSESAVGSYFCWGETAVKDSYRSNNYKFYAGQGNNGWKLYNKYVTYVNNGKIDNLVALQAEDDAAHAVLKGTWRIPHDSEWTELKDKCSWTFDDNGATVIGPNGNSIFLPLTGTKIDDGELYWENKGYYLGAEVALDDNSNCCALEFEKSKSSVKLTKNSRYAGFNIRAVTD